MVRIAHLVLLAPWLLISSAVAAEPTKKETEAVEIPLKEIWAYQMPGTLDVYDLEPKSNTKLPPTELERSPIWRLSKALGKLPKENEKAGTAFVVAGSGLAALEKASEVFSSRNDHRTEFASDDPLSLVFFSHLCGRYVRLVSVERAGSEFKVKYKFVSHQTTEMTKHFAIIPIGKLPPGKYQVDIQQAEPTDSNQKPTSRIDNPDRFVSSSFSFDVH